MGSDESHFNVSVGSDGQSHKTVSTNHNLFEDKGAPKRHRTEVLPLTNRTPYRWAKPAHSYITFGVEGNRYALQACQLRVAVVGTLEDRGRSDDVMHVHVLNPYMYVAAVSVLIGFKRR